MSYKGKVVDGKVVLAPEVNLPDGAEVRVQVVDELSQLASTTFHERYSRFIVAADDLPTDLAENLDHYLHGHPKK